MTWWLVPSIVGVVLFGVFVGLLVSRMVIRLKKKEPPFLHEQTILTAGASAGGSVYQAAERPERPILGTSAYKPAKLPESPAAEVPVYQAATLTESPAVEAYVDQAAALPESPAAEAPVYQAPVLPEGPAEEAPADQAAEQSESPAVEAPVDQAPVLPESPAEEAPADQAATLPESSAVEAPADQAAALPESSALEAPVDLAPVLPESPAESYKRVEKSFADLPTDERLQVYLDMRRKSSAAKTPLSPALTEINNNLLLAKRPATKTLENFQTDIWKTQRSEFNIISAELMGDLTEVYVDMMLANNIVWLVMELGRDSPDLRDSYNNLCHKVAERLDRILPALRDSFK
jgi:hypothetical protein